MSKSREFLRQLDNEFRESAEGYGFKLRLDFAEILWRALRQLGWSQAEFAKASGWSDSFVSNLVHANQNCELDTVGKALHVLGIRGELRVSEELSTDKLAFVWQGEAIHIPHVTEISRDSTHGEDPEETFKFQERSDREAEAGNIESTRWFPNAIAD